MWEVPLTPSGLCGEEWGELETGEGRAIQQQSGDPAPASSWMFYVIRGQSLPASESHFPCFPGHSGVTRGTLGPGSSMVLPGD